jgi:hypothetical protein
MGGKHKQGFGGETWVKETLFIENQQIHQNDHFIVMFSQTLLHVSAYQCHHQGTHMILTRIIWVPWWWRYAETYRNFWPSITIKW